MNRLSVDHRTANHGAAIDGTGFTGRPVGRGAVSCDDPIGIIFEANDGDIERFANARRILSNDIQHRLNVRRRASNDAQNFTRRRLLLQRFLQLLEQPHVLDGDDCLVGEGFKQLDLRRGEGAHLGPACGQSPNEFPLLTKGND